ncbi:hypothetical protein B0H21DRAFT_826463 [Amylocystis lapponica]|nr:hypothetical protein B0H21DRAFT_826463 [Amylocystis lapponica]
MDTVQVPDSVEEGDRIQDADFWFIDGNIILIAQRTLFCVHRGETINDCPVVQLSDTADDLRRLLRAVYDGASFLRHDRQLEFSAVASLIRLSHKYQMEELQEHGVTRLKSCFPDSYDKFVRATVARDYSSPLTRCVPEDAIAVVALATLINDTRLLSVALYICTQLDASILFHGVKRADVPREQLCERDFGQFYKRTGNIMLSRAAPTPPAVSPRRRNADNDIGDG